MRSTLLIISLFVISTLSYAQTWQWGEKIGSPWELPNSAEETPEDLATDNNGNSYLLSHVYGTGLSVGNDTVVRTLTSNARNVLITSFDCRGRFRWKKTIGAPSGAFAKSIQTDTLGGVYVMARSFIFGVDRGYIDTDTFLLGESKQFQIIKFDTLGDFQWVRTPLSSASTFMQIIYDCQPIDMHVSKSGAITIAAQFPAGAHTDLNLNLSQKETHVVKFDAQGNFIGTFPLAFNILGTGATYQESCNMTIANNGNILISGYKFNAYFSRDSIFINNQLFRDYSFLIQYSPTGAYQWKQSLKYYTQFAYGGFFKRVATDEQNNIYLSGYGFRNDTLAGYVFENTLMNVGHSCPFVAKFSSSGNLLWAKNGSVNSASLGYGTSYANGKVGITGSSPGRLRWSSPPRSLNNNNQGYAPFIAIFDANNGNILRLDSLVNARGFSTRATNIGVDSKSNFFIAGTVVGGVSIAGNALAALGDNDVFIAKYGTSDCNFETVSNISENAEMLDWSISPNPANTSFNIRLPNSSSETTIEVHNILGQKIAQSTILDGQVSLDCSQWPSGIYIVSNTQGTQKESRLLVKQ